MGGVTGSAAPTAGCAVVQDGTLWRRFESPTKIVEAYRADEVRPALRTVEEAIGAGACAVGFIAYEAAAAFGLTVRESPPGHPLLWFGLYREGADTGPPEPPEGPVAPSPWTASLDEEGYARAVAALHERIASGETYQVNFTFSLRAELRVDPWLLFRALRQLQGGRSGAYLDTGRFAIASVSPETFFRWDGDRITTRPMKGTAARGRTPAEDAARVADLHGSEKDRAENLMIVDMLRNDLGKIAAGGSVRVDELFRVERYPTVLQMTSTVSARSDAALADIFEALFPCASVTGAPKVRTMEIIAATEVAARGVYTGAVGWVGPGRRAQFDVAIRTAVADRERGEIVYSVGSGIVADSTAENEYAECLLKARVLGEAPFRLLETMRFAPAEGVFLLEEHLARLLTSAAHFGVPLSRRSVLDALRALAPGLAEPTRVRLLVDMDGRIELLAFPLEAPSGKAHVVLADRPVDDRSPWLYHKTTRREIYDAALAAHPEADDVVLWNTRGEITEACRSNVVVDLGAGRVTPPVSSGLLPGTFRSRLLASGEVGERVVTTDELRRAGRCFLINSVQGFREAVLDPEVP